MRRFVWIACVAAVLEAQTKAPKIWDDKALEDWATPIAALEVRPGHFTSAEYYSSPSENLKSYPVYRPDREPPGYWEWLHQQKPQPLVDATKLYTREDWAKAGEMAFQTLEDPARRRDDRAAIEALRNPASYDGVWTRDDGTLLVFRWVVTERGVRLGVTACSACHGRPHADGTVVWGAPFGQLPSGPIRYNPTLPSGRGAIAPFIGDSRGMAFWRQYTVPWAPDRRIEEVRGMDDQAFLVAFPRLFAGVPTDLSVFPRIHGSPFYMTKIPDLNPIRYSHYMDATGTHKLRGPEDIARYAAIITGADPMEFGHYKILTPEQRQVRFHYADEVLYAIGVYLMSLEPPKNPEAASMALVARGQEIFESQRCSNCHVPPNYTNGKLTLAQGFTPPTDHPNKSDIASISVGTDPGLAMKTRKGTGFYKIPSLRGVWYRPVLLHDGSVASLEEMFDPDRLKPDHVPGGWKGPGVTKRAITGHPFGIGLNSEDKKALFAFLRSL